MLKQLGEAMKAGKIKKLEARRARLQVDLSRAVADKAEFSQALDDIRADLALGGEEARLAALRVDEREIFDRLATATERERSVSSQLQAAETEHSTLQREIAEEAELARIRAIPGARVAFFEATERVEELARELGDRMREEVTMAKHLAWAAGVDAQRAALSVAQIRRRHVVLFAHFGLLPADGSGVLPEGEACLLFNERRLGMQDQVAMGLLALTKAETAEVAAFYGSRRDADRARFEIDPTGKTLHVSEDPRSGLWVLRRGQHKHALLHPASHYQQQGDGV